MQPVCALGFSSFSPISNPPFQALNAISPTPQIHRPSRIREAGPIRPPRPPIITTTPSAFATTCDPKNVRGRGYPRNHCRARPRVHHRLVRGTLQRTTLVAAIRRVRDIGQAGPHHGCLRGYLRTPTRAVSPSGSLSWSKSNRKRRLAS